MIDPLNEFAVGAVNRGDTGLVLPGGFKVFFYTVEISPLALAGNTTYWLSIVNDTNLDPDDYWGWNEEPTSDQVNAVVRNEDGTAWRGPTGFNFGFRLIKDAGDIFEQTVFDQTVNLASGAPPSDFDFGQQVADDFQLQPGASTITDVLWWGLYGNTNTPGTDNFTIRIFADRAVTVPEPATWAMFAAGLAGLGWMSRRRTVG